MKGRYNPKADYDTPDFWKNFNGWVHGPAPLMPFNRGDSPEYQQLIRGDLSVKVDGPWWGAFSMEGLRCLIANDTEGGLTAWFAGRSMPPHSYPTEILRCIFLSLINSLHPSTARAAKLQTYAQVMLAPLILLAMSIFYLWPYIRRGVDSGDTRST